VRLVSTATNDVPEVLHEVEGVERAHLFYSGREATVPDKIQNRPTVSEAEFVRVALSLRTALVLRATAASLLTSAVLWGGLVAHFVWHPTAPPEAAAVILVVLPAAFAALVIPAEHQLVRKMFRGLRLLVFVSALLSFLAGAAVAVRFSPGTREEIWLGLAASSAVVTSIATSALTKTYVGLKLAARRRNRRERRSRTYAGP
jgi:hypothetical protein